MTAAQEAKTDELSTTERTMLRIKAEWRAQWEADLLSDEAIERCCRALYDSYPKWAKPAYGIWRSVVTTLHAVAAGPLSTGETGG